MDQLRLSLPLDQGLFRRLTELLEEEGEPGASMGIQWLREHNSDTAMLEAVREGWARSSLPLREWASRIDCVEAWIRGNALVLDVHLFGGNPEIVRQAPPITSEQLRTCLETFPAPIPSLLLELAVIAPGLTLDNHDRLAPPEYFADRLGDVGRSFQTTTPEEVPYGFEHLDRDRHLIEAAMNRIGDSYLVGTDGSVYFFDHEACGILPCSLSLEQLVHRYFDARGDILDPYSMGWAEEPQEPKTDGRHEPPLTVILFQKIRQLSSLSSIALAVRGCRRSMISHYVPSIPRKWKKCDQELADIIDRCQAVAETGRPCCPRWATEATDKAKQMTHIWRRIWQASDLDWNCTGFTFHSLPVLLSVCADIKDLHAAREAAGCCSIVDVSQREDAEEANHLAAISDVDLLLSMGLGGPDEIGRPVPASFFKRPLWPEDT